MKQSGASTNLPQCKQSLGCSNLQLSSVCGPSLWSGSLKLDSAFDSPENSPAAFPSVLHECSSLYHLCAATEANGKACGSSNTMTLSSGIILGHLRAVGPEHRDGKMWPVRANELVCCGCVTQAVAAHYQHRADASHREDLNWNACGEQAPAVWAAAKKKFRAFPRRFPGTSLKFCFMLN